MKHREGHLVHRVGWLRAEVLGANDGIVSTASLILGMAASGANAAAILVAGSARSKTLWGALAMLVTAGVGSLLGVSV